MAEQELSRLVRGRAILNRPAHCCFPVNWANSGFGQLLLTAGPVTATPKAFSEKLWLENGWAGVLLWSFLRKFRINRASLTNGPVLITLKPCLKTN